MMITHFIVKYWLNEDEFENMSKYFLCYNMYGVSALDSSVLLGFSDPSRQSSYGRDYQYLSCV